jgi:Leucine-rich repeat (LRR) protein
MTGQSTPIVATVVGDHTDKSSIESSKDLAQVAYCILLRDRRVLVTLFLLLLIIVGLAIGLALALVQKSDNGSSPTVSPERKNQPSLFPTTSPTNSPTQESLRDYLISISPDGGASLRNASSPQRLALDLLETDPNLDSYNSEQMNQKYAMHILRFMIIGYSNVDILGVNKSEVPCDSCQWEGRRLSDVAASLFDECSWPFLYCNGFGQLTNLEMIYMDYSFTIPAEFSFLKNIRRISLYSNSIFGTLPSELGQLINMEELLLSGDFSSGGTIPTEYGNIQSLINMKLSYMGFSGIIPSEFGQLTNLHTLDVESNFLSGTIPPDIFSNPQLCYVYVGNNLLRGLIPSEIGAHTILKEFRASENELTGHIPTQVGRLSNHLASFQVYDK